MNNLTQGKVFSSLIRFAIPFLLANLLQSLYGAVDLLIVGRFATTEDVSGVTTGSQCMAIATFIIIGLTTGTTVTLGQYAGAKRKDDMAKTIGTSLLFFLGIAVFLTLLSVFLNSPIVKLMNTPAQAMEETLSYFLICSLGIPFITAYNLAGSILRGLGNSRTPLLFVGIACIINIALDLLFVSGFHLGATGAALATVMAQAGSSLFAFLYLRKNGLGVPFGKKEIGIHPVQTKKILGTGLPLAFQNILVTASFLLILLVINKRGLVASASVGVVEKLIEFLMMPAIAFGAAVAVMAAQNFGAGQHKRARHSMWCGIGITFCFACISTAVCQIDGTLLTRLFTSDAQVVVAAADYLKGYSWDCLLTCFIFNMGGYFNGTGHAMFNMIQNSLTSFGVRIPATILLSGISGSSLFLIGLAAPISSIISIIICLFFLLYLSKRKGFGRKTL